MSVVRWLQRKFVGPVRVYFKNAADIRRLSALQKGGAWASRHVLL